MTLDPAGNIVVAGYGGSQSMVVVRFNSAGQYNASAVCYAPHLIDYSARAVAVGRTAASCSSALRATATRPSPSRPART